MKTESIFHVNLVGSKVIELKTEGTVLCMHGKMDGESSGGQVCNWLVMRGSVNRGLKWY